MGASIAAKRPSGPAGPRMICEIRAQADDDMVDLLIYDVIGEGWDGSGVSAKHVAETLKGHRAARQINVSLNSAGGSVFDALAIYNTLSNHAARVVVHIDGAALSAASLIAMAGDDIAIAENAMMMIHDPHGVVMGGAADMRQMADQLDKAKATLVTTYAARTGQTTDDIAAWMTAETWMTAEEALAAHFADRVIAAKRIAAQVDLSQFEHAPPWVGRLINPEPRDEATEMADEQKKREPACQEEEEKKKAQEEEEEEKKAQEEEEEKKAQEEEEEEKKKKEQPASIAALRSGLPGASSDFILACAEQGLTVAQAKALAGLNAQPAPRSGGPGLPNADGKGKARGGLATGDFVADAKAYAAEHKCTLARAMSALAAADPEGHAAWVDSQPRVER